MVDKKYRRYLRSMVVIITVIILFMLHIINYEASKFYKFNHIPDAFISNKVEDFDESAQKEFSACIDNFMPQRMDTIEIYDKNFNLLFQENGHNELKHNDITEYPELIAILESNKSGYCSIETLEEISDVFFEWVEDDNNHTSLVLMVKIRDRDASFWQFVLMCYAIIVLMFALAITILIRQWKVNTRQYQRLIKE